ncbi:TIR domain-containing protein [Flavobacterium sp. WV_118_3]|uniref:TIR domain-containing protein n=1 Tax=Flavobacterium sp. WV_118_3 TaxID=3151764 RepID=UPI00321A222D
MDDSELYVLSLITEYLANNGYFIETSHNNSIFPGQNIEYNIQTQINKSDLFIGIASHFGINSQWVLKEWELAQKNGKTAFFLIEDNLPINPAFEQGNLVVRFNRQNPQYSITRLHSMIEKRKKEKSNNALNWVVGGLLGIAIIKLLSEDD